MGNASMARTPPAINEKTFGKEIINPVTGMPAIDPLERFAIESGNWYKNKKGAFRPNWNGIKRAVYPHWEIPRYFGFTEDEQQLYYKLCSESFYPLRAVGYLLGLKTPSMGVRFCVQASVPIYRIEKVLYVFSGDIVRAIAACRVDYSDPVVRAVVERHQARRWDGAHWLRQKRSPAIRQEGEVPGQERQDERSTG